MATVLLLGPARQAAGTSMVSTDAATIDDICAELVVEFGSRFADTLAVSRVWIDGNPAVGGDRVPPGAQVSILPPVSGG